MTTGYTLKEMEKEVLDLKQTDIKQQYVNIRKPEVHW